MDKAYHDPELIRQIHECRPLIRIDLRPNKGHARIRRMTDDLKKQKRRTLYRQAFTYRFG